MLSVIICTYNREKYLSETLRRLANNRYNGEWELLLIDNNSTDSTASICKDFATQYSAVPFRYLVETQQGLSYARNRGIKEAKGEWFVFLDDDAFVSENYLERLSLYIQQIPDMDAFGGRIYPLFEEGATPSWLSKWSASWLSAIDKGNNVCLFTKDYPIGANMGFSKITADRCGLFNTSLGRSGKNLIGGEEKDYFNRIKALNVPIYYLPEIAVEHCIPSSRTTDEYIYRLGLGVGQSERQRTLAISKIEYSKRLFLEAVKWGGTLALWIGYCLQGHPAKGNKLILFRRNVTKGLL
ncbi:MAG: glycosyltransferase [Paludibacteraceae bacterium]|nr:glycosyltransferase [Paludibacteraceae bacterium]